MYDARISISSSSSSSIDGSAAVVVGITNAVVSITYICIII